MILTLYLFQCKLTKLTTLITLLYRYYMEKRRDSFPPPFWELRNAAAWVLIVVRVQEVKRMQLLSMCATKCCYLANLFVHALKLTRPQHVGEG